MRPCRISGRRLSSFRGTFHPTSPMATLKKTRSSSKRTAGTAPRVESNQDVSEAGAPIAARAFRPGQRMDGTAPLVDSRPRRLRATGHSRRERASSSTSAKRSATPRPTADTTTRRCANITRSVHPERTNVRRCGVRRQRIAVPQSLVRSKLRGRHQPRAHLDRGDREASPRARSWCTTISTRTTPKYTEEDLRFYACHCGSPKCRGTIVKTRKKLRPMSALRALLGGIVDYAGLFPPAALDMPTAVRNYAAYRARSRRVDARADSSFRSRGSTSSLAARAARRRRRATAGDSPRCSAPILSATSRARASSIASMRTHRSSIRSRRSSRRPRTSNGSVALLAGEFELFVEMPDDRDHVAIDRRARARRRSRPRSERAASRQRRFLAAATSFGSSAVPRRRRVVQGDGRTPSSAPGGVSV